jgi:hypothetical protein
MSDGFGACFVTGYRRLPEERFLQRRAAPQRCVARFHSSQQANRSCFAAKGEEIMKTKALWVGTQIAFVFVALVLLCPSTVQAQNPNSRGEEMRNKVSEVISHTETLTTNLDKLCPPDTCQNKPSGQMLKTKIDRVKAAHARLKAAHGRTSPADFQETLRKRGKGSSQGCNKEVQVCTDQPGTSVAAQPADDYDDLSGADVVADLTDVDNGISELNSVLEKNPLASDFTLEDADYFFSVRPSDEASFAAFLAQLVAVKAMAVGTHFCNQTAVALGFGGNTSAACAVWEGVSQVVSGVYETMAYMDGSFQGAEITAIYNRTKTLFKQASKTDGLVDSLMDKVIGMEAKLLQMERNQLYIIQLLNMPQGQRPAFPTKPL